MGRRESEATIGKRRRKIGADLNIVKRLAEEAKLKAEEDPKLFVEYLTIDIYLEMMLDPDKQTRYKAAKDMLAFTLAKKRPQGMGLQPEADQKLFKPNLPPPREKEPIPAHIQEKVFQIKQGNAKK